MRSLQAPPTPPARSEDNVGPATGSSLFYGSRATRMHARRNPRQYGACGRKTPALRDERQYRLAGTLRATLFRATRGLQSHAAVPVLARGPVPVHR